MTVVTRIAPSPTGKLHIGTARTALFCKLFAQHMGGKYLGRIEDTDKERSTEENVQLIEQALDWLDLQPDEPWVYQSKHEARHKELAEKLLAEGKAYKCFATAEELEQMREEQRARNENPMYDNRWRERNDHPEGMPYVVRLKTDLEGYTSWDDIVQGHIDYPNTQIDDFIILRSDGSPTYQLAVVADDHDMGVTHVVRGDDHINNTPKQIMLYKALGFDVPHFAHMPLIHGEDGKKLSKRHGAVAAMDFKDMGYLKEALVNYMLRLGWSAGDLEKINYEEAIKLFELKDITKSPANMDMQKLNWLNGEYLKDMSPEAILEEIMPYLNTDLSISAKERLIKGLPGLVQRENLLPNLAKAADIYIADSVELNEQAAQKLADADKDKLAELVSKLEQTPWEEDELSATIKGFVKETGLKMPMVMMPLRAALVGTPQAPGVSELLIVIGKDESLNRLKAQF